jgi:succinyl-diaminopimelate desuccinylase
MTLAERTLELCAIPSVTGEEAEICAFVERWARARFLDDEVGRVGNALVVAPRRREGVPLVGLFGHLDTVLPSPDQPCEIRDGKLYGCGASDMKAGLAVMMAMLEKSYRCDLLAVFYDREEGPVDQSGLPAVLEHLPRVDLAVMLEPTANHLQLGCVGGVHARVRFRGRRAHSARPWQGDNAIYKALPLLERLRARQRVEVTVEGLSFYEVMTPTVLATYNSQNVVPDAVMVNVNFRFAPNRSTESAIAEIERVVDGEGEIEIADVAPPGAVARSHPLVTAWIARCGLVPEPKQAWTDVARMSAIGVPALNMGPGDPAQAHQAGEWVEVDALETGLRILEQLVS